MRHVHLDPLGGAAGDMFVACMLDACPEHRDAVLEAAAALARTLCRTIPHNDATLTGLRFEVDVPQGHHDSHGHHGHTAWRGIQAMLDASALEPAVRAHAAGIFKVLAEAEGRVHGVAADEVTFHEIGAVDSIADIVAAAAIIEAMAPATWSVGPLPVGGGTVRTAHGPMPVPAPATALLLQGFSMHNDGITGERVTPTGAAILRYLRCQPMPPALGTLRRSGYGFGSRSLPGISNCLRALVFETEATAATPGHRELAVISFEVDDQSGEELAMGLDRLRDLDGVHDVLQMAAFGKKSRMAVHVQVLTAPGTLDAIVAACFQETTTIGLRTHLVQGRALPRRMAAMEVGGHPVSVKLVERPGGITGKAEADHLRSLPSHAARTRLRRDAEQLAQANAANPA